MSRSRHNNIQTKNTSKRQLVLISAGLILLIAIAFEPIRHNTFVDYDDRPYITNNRHVQNGFTRDSIVWAFNCGYAANWHPLTWLSHMADVEIFGLNPLGHHLHNLFLHSVSTLLLFWLLYKITGSVWPSAFVAMAFGIHPLRVESVAWAAERKDVLSTLFFMLTVAAYLYYVKRGGVGRYLLVMACFILGLTAKPMLVTLPIVLLLLDYWPLKRIQGDIPSKGHFPDSYESKSFVGLVMEKIPLFLLVLLSCIITYAAQKAGQAVNPISFHIRLFNAVGSYAAYIGKIFRPVDLAVLYPYSAVSNRLWPSGLAFLLLLIVTGYSIYCRRTKPYLVTGWFWYMTTLIPVIGLIQVGSQSMADRYTYLPSIGIFILIAWSVAQLTSTWRNRKFITGLAFIFTAFAMVIVTRNQVTNWKDSITLFEHTLDVTENNYIIHTNLGRFLGKQNRLEEAEEHIQKALQINPDYAEAHVIMGLILASRQQPDKAESHLRKALEQDPDFVEANQNMAIVLAQQMRFDEAMVYISKAQKSRPDDDAIYFNMALIQEALNKTDDAIRSYQEAVKLKPGYTRAYRNLGFLLQKNRQFKEAVNCFRTAASLEPNNPEMLQALAWMLATTADTEIRNPQEALIRAQKACELTHFKNPSMLDTLAAAYAANGQFKEAAAIAQKAIDLCQASGQTDLTPQIEKRLQLYRTSKAYYEPESNS